jgi:hypothetical protein
LVGKKIAMMFRSLALLVAPLLLLQACATAPEGGFAQAGPPPATTAGECNAAQAQFAVGRTLDDNLRAQVLSSTGARTVRVYRTGDAITMDFSAQRLNLELDAAGKVVKASCG